MAFTKNNTRFFHYDAYKAYCCDPKTSEIYRTYGEAYESDRMLEAQREIQGIKLDIDCKLPRCAAAIMVFSDATQLAQFGNAKAWPIRITFGNLSKYERCKPNSQNHYEIAFIPSLPANIQDKIRSLENDKKIPKALLTHLRRELFHEVWNHLLDSEFLRAWRQGVVIQCADGITRRVFPRIFSYSADYPEKVLLATIRGMQSLFPCTRCMMPVKEFPLMGTPNDLKRRQDLKRMDSKDRTNLVREARSIIYSEGRTVNSKRVERLLQPYSYVPTYNAFSRRLLFLGFDVFESLTVDFLHEVELGVWKSVFQHILRVLESSSSSSVVTFNERFRLVPPFGDGTIRPFSEDVSNMSRPAARNYEDVLQCIIPVLEGLLPRSIENLVLTLLYVLAQWHGLAKLRRHTSVTITALRHATTRLGHELREFRRYTSELNVYETSKEKLNREKRIRKKARPRAALAIDSEAADPEPETCDAERDQKYFNLETIKLHSLGDYADTIEQVGTTDSFSTQTGELLHRHSKQRYTRTNGRQYLPQMERIQRIEARLEDIHHNLSASSQTPVQNNPSSAATYVTAPETLPAHDAGRSPYKIAASQKNVIVLPVWLDKHQSDPAVKDFVIRLKSHLLARIVGDRYEEEAPRTSSELVGVQLQHDRMYAHQTLQLHYTTYDVRRSQDLINLNTQKRFVLVPSDKVDTPTISADRFWYARVLGIYHANVSYKGSRPKRMDFLWVRWLSRMTDVPGGWGTCRLDQLGYFPDSELDHAFDFVDPLDVIRAVHLIPRFIGGRTTEYLGSLNSLAADNPPTGDWKHHYIGRFADRDMLMRFTGMAIGHITLGCKPDSTVGVPVDVLTKGYEYMEEPTLEGDSTEIPTDSGINDQGEISDDEIQAELEDESDQEGGSAESENDEIIGSDVEEDVEW